MLIGAANLEPFRSVQDVFLNIAERGGIVRAHSELKFCLVHALEDPEKLRCGRERDYASLAQFVDRPEGRQLHLAALRAQDLPSLLHRSMFRLWKVSLRSIRDAVIGAPPMAHQMHDVRADVPGAAGGGHSGPAASSRACREQLSAASEDDESRRPDPRHRNGGRARAQRGGRRGRFPRPRPVSSA